MIIYALSNNPQQENTSATIPNRSVCVIAFPYRENFLAKEDKFLASGTGRPRHRRGTPYWCHGFCQRENKVITV